MVGRSFLSLLKLQACVLACVFLLATAAEPPLEFVTLEGKTEKLELREQDAALVVHFWATWCPDCAREWSHLARAAERCAETGVRILAVNVGESREVVEKFLREQEVQLPTFRDPAGEVWRRLSGRGLPLHYTWTHQGRTLELGPRTTAAWEEDLRRWGCEKPALLEP